MSKSKEMFSVDRSRINAYLIDPKKILIKPELNGRFEDTDIAELAASIEANGQLEPVIVRKEGEQPVLLAGFRRWRAIMEINSKRKGNERLPILAVYRRCDDQQGFRLNWAENEDRKDRTELDEAVIFHQWEAWGRTPKETAELLGLKNKNGNPDVHRVKSRLALVETDPAVKKALVEGRIKAPAAVRLAKMTPAEQRAAIKDSNGKAAVSKPASTRPSMKVVLAFVQETADSDDADDAVRKFCRRLVKMMEGE